MQERDRERDKELATERDLYRKEGTFVTIDKKLARKKRDFFTREKELAREGVWELVR